MNKHFGFTLAEVMVTLGLLGVLAAMTIPTLTYNYRSKLLESQFRATYKEVKEIGSYLNNEHGDLGDYSKSQNYQTWDKNFMSYINGAHQYSDARPDTNPKVGTVVMNYYKKAGTAGGIHKFGSGRGSVIGGFCDNDGLWTDAKGRIWTFNAEFHMVCVDVNGASAPNMYNVDIFVFIPMSASQVARWVYDGTAADSNQYSGQMVLCDANAIVSSANNQSCDDVNKPTKDPTGQSFKCALDLCPFNFPLENTAPRYSEGQVKNRLGKVVKKSDDYWKDYIQYK